MDARDVIAKAAFGHWREFSKERNPIAEAEFDRMDAATRATWERCATAILAALDGAGYAVVKTDWRIVRLEITPDVYLEERDDDSWCISNGVAVMNRDGSWEYEPQPSSRTAEFKERTRFPRKEAWERAMIAAARE